MIGTYLNSIYFNCKSLQKTSNYVFQHTETFFNDQIKLILEKLHFETEEEIISLLSSKKYAELIPLLDEFPFLKIFYFINSFSEYQTSIEDRDELNRLKFSKSAQIQTGISENLVWSLMSSTINTYGHLNTSFKINTQKSYFFLSHDIDSLNGSTLQDGLWALKNKRFDVLFRLFINILIAKPHWFNIDLIMELESEYDFRSTFYWLVNKGRIDKRQTNSDYNIKSEKIGHIIEKINKNGFENGLHKSISDEAFKSELYKLPVKVVGNRYHYLKFTMPEGYTDLEKSGLKFDGSLGFAEHFGFRNNYGYPFSPYNPITRSHYSFLEVPLNVMDGTFQRYMRIPVNKTAETVIEFLEKNSRDCLLSILWHNTFFTDYKYKGYKEEYIKILQYLYEKKFTNINQTQIIETFSWQTK